MNPRFLADKSALTRMKEPVVAEWLRPLLEEGLVATCAIVDLEVLYSARSPADYEAIWEERQAFPDVPISPQIMATALRTQRRLAERGRHRVPIPDLIIAAAAESAGLEIIHCDADYELIAKVTAQPQRWVVPRERP